MLATTLTVRSVLTNNGPCDQAVSVRETLTVTGPSDCVIGVEPGSSELVINAFSSETLDQLVTVTCDLPSSHEFLLGNAISLTEPGVADIDVGNNTDSFLWEVPVLADADLAIENLDLTCDAEVLVDVPFECTLVGDAVNHGPYGPVEADISFDIAPAGDCSATLVSYDAAIVWIDAGDAAPITTVWDVPCTDRSDHHHDAGASVEAVDEHVVDIGGNNTAAAGTDNEVFEYAELAVDDVRILCTEIWDGDPFTCTLDVDVENEGPGTDVAVIISGELTGSDSCITVESRLQTVPRTLAAGEQLTETFTWLVSCPEDSPHVFTAYGRIIQDEPHVIDEPGNNEAKIVWIPIDFKAFSDPNTVNLGRGGLTSVAILATTDFDPFSQIDVDSLRFGPNEASAVRCSTQPEDLNGDGLGDMSCKFKNSEIGWYLGQTLVYLTGELVNGDSFMAADEVRIIE